MRINWQPMLPLWITLPLMTAMVLLVLYYARHCLDDRRWWRYALTTTRLAVLAVILLAMLGPTRVDEMIIAREGSPQLIVLLDASDSMHTSDTAAGTRLMSAVDQWLNSDALATVAETHQVRVAAFGGDALTISLDQADKASTLIDRQSTDLGRALDTARRLTADHHGSASVLLLTDGHDTTGQRIIAPRDLAVFAVPIGSPNGAPDIDVQVAAMQSQLYVTETGQVRITIRQRGSAEHAVLLSVRLDDAPQQLVLPFAGGTATADLPITFDTTGSHAITVSVAPLQGETITVNNVAQTFVDVTDERPEVLIVEADPTWDTRFMAEAIARDDRLALTQFTQIGEARTQVTRSRSRLQTDLPPQTAEQWAAFDIVVLGGSLHRVIDQRAALALLEAVRTLGVTVLLTRPVGVTSDAVDRMLADVAPLQALDGGAIEAADWPSEPQNIVTSAVLEDIDLPAWPSELPSLDVTTVGPAADAQVLVTASNGRPMLAMRPMGRGRVMAWNGQGLWTWAMQAPDEARGDLIVDALWMQLVHLTLGDSIAGGTWALRVEPARQRVGDAAVVTLRSRLRPLDPDAITITVIAPSGERTAIAWPREVIGRREQEWLFTVTEHGTYTFEATDHGDASTPVRQARVAAYDDNEETLDPRARPELLRSLAEFSGGALLDPADPDVLNELLQARLVSADVTQRNFTPLWTNTAPLMLVLILLGIEWIVRKQLGLT